MLRFVEALERQVNEMHSFMLLRHGNVVAEGWWAPYQSESPHQLFSLYTNGFHFAGDELLLESQINVSLGARQTMLLTARSQPPVIADGRIP